MDNLHAAQPSLTSVNSYLSTGQYFFKLASEPDRLRTAANLIRILQAIQLRGDDFEGLIIETNNFGFEVEVVLGLDIFAQMARELK